MRRLVSTCPRLPDVSALRAFEAAAVGELASHRSHLFIVYLLALEAAIAGRGVALVLGFVGATHLQTGRLVQPFLLAVPQPGAKYLVYRRERALNHRVHRLSQWLAVEAAANSDVSPKPC